MKRACSIALLIGATFVATAAVAQPSERLVVLVPTGDRQDGLPAMQRLADPAAHLSVLERGYSGRLLHLYAAVQHYLQHTEGRTPEPAYLALTSETGGFPRVGLSVDGIAKPTAGWVDLRAGGAISGRFGAMDQIFPHELWHVIHLQLVGQPDRGLSRQIHALGVRTDPATAFAEGLAEHAQVLAIDDPDASPDTAALRDGSDLCGRVERELHRYGQQMQRRLWPLAPQQLRFLVWFSATEQAQRYFHIRENRFGREPQLPSALLDDGRLYHAWLLSSVVPAPAEAPPRPGAVQWSIDGPVAHFFWRLATDASLASRAPQADLASLFGLNVADLAPLDGVYLRLFRVLHLDKPSTTAALMMAWQRRFPEDAADLDRIAAAALLDQTVPSAAEVWVDGASLVLGTSLFDQFRGVPQMHNFDANAATELDWLSVPGVDRTKARALLDGAPYASLDDLVRRSGIPRASLVQEQTGPRVGPEGLSLRAVAMPYLWRILGLWAIATLLATAAQALAGSRWGWSVVRGVTGSALTLASGLILTAPPWVFVLIPVMACGLPGWLLRGSRGQGWLPTNIGFWLLAALPALALLQ